LRNTTYSKKFPNDAKEKYYFEELQKRVRDKSQDLKTFLVFLKFCEKVRNIMVPGAEEK